MIWVLKQVWVPDFSFNPPPNSQSGINLSAKGECESHVTLVKPASTSNLRMKNVYMLKLFHISLMMTMMLAHLITRTHSMM